MGPPAVDPNIGTADRSLSLTPHDGAAPSHSAAQVLEVALPRAAVLLVEDEWLIQGLLQIVLDEAGYDVLVASDGAEALALLDARADQIEGLVTDINLGSGPNGWDVAERARDLRSALPVVYITGDNEHLWRGRGVENSILLAKPFNPEQVVKALASLFDRGSDNG